MRIIVDTNVVMSGIFFGGVPGRILDAWAEGRLELVLSPDDDRFLAAASAADVSVIISGDRDLLDVSGWRNVMVLSPRQFADRHLLAG